MGDLRTKKSQAVYEAYKAAGHLATCKLCEATPLQTFKYWVIIGNAFPYDRIAATHDMIVPKRHVAEEGVSQEEWREYATIKNEVLHTTYEFMIEATHRKKSIPGHFHIHLLTVKD